jgi:1,4-dihydroxy-6-naphthoate synthase
MKKEKIALTLGFSPCPNDTFMFDALVNGRIAIGDFSFNTRLEDVETLNRLALNETLDITKLSFAAYSRVMDKYQLLTSGSALGNGVGPLFVSKKLFANVEAIKSVAIPGLNTTAYFLFKMFFPTVENVKEYVFSDIEQAILDGEVDAGIIIHENRFTFKAKGLTEIADLGELWEHKTGLPIPLGGIAVRRSLPDDIKRKINDLVRSSVLFAFTHPKASAEYVKAHSQEMSEEVTKKHIQLYVNNYSVNLDERGKNAIHNFIHAAGVKPERVFVV